VFINSEGLPTYETKDVGLSLTKWQDYAFDESIIITANEQTQYMQVVIKAVEQFLPEPAQRTKHITHGVLKLSGGVKMSSRLGNVLSAKNLMEAAREAGASTNTSNDESVVLAAVKYGLLKSRIGGDIIYDPEESVAMEGNSGPYLQYAHARAKSIMRKSGVANTDISEVFVFEDEERIMVRKLTEYTDVVERSTRELAPHYICTYLYELSQVFNRFYESNKVIGHERETIRLWVVDSYASVLSSGLGLLGIKAPDSM
jgi:arginyl-tRNA synthetase